MLSFIRIKNTLTDFFLNQTERLPLWLPVAFGTGIGCYFLLPFEPLLTSGFALFLCSCFLLRDTRRKPALFLATLFVFAFCGGFFSTQFHTRMLSAPKLKYPLPAAKTTGKIEEVIDLTNGVQVVANDIKINTLSRWKTPEKIRFFLPESIPSPQKGDVFQATLRLTPLKGPVTLSGFDAGKQMYFKRIGATGTLAGGFKILETANGTRLRDKINARFESVLPDETRPIAKALITGNAKSIPSDIVRNYRNAGIAPVLAVSGLHMSLLAGLFFAVIRTLLVFIPRISLYYDTKKIAAVCALSLCGLYLYVSGASYAAQRAFIMIALVLSAVLLNRRALSVVSVAWAAFFVLLIAPQALTAAGFQLSFAAVTALICTWEKGEKEYARLSEKKEGVLFSLSSTLIALFGTSFIACAATMPFALFHFRQFPLYAVFSGALATALTGFWIMPSLIVGTLLMPLGMDEVFLHLGSVGIALLNRIAEGTASLPHAVLSCPPIPLYGLICAAFGELWLCLWKGRVRLWGICLFVFGLISPFITPMPDAYIHLKNAAFRNEEGFLTFRENSSDPLLEKIWLSDNHQEQKLTFKCPYGFCLYEKNGFKIGVAYKKAGAYDACERTDLDMLFITNSFNEKCPVKKQVNRTEIKSAGTYLLYLKPKDIIVKTVTQTRGFRPWSASSPVLSITEDWRALTDEKRDRIQAVIEQKD